MVTGSIHVIKYKCSEIPNIRISIILGSSKSLVLTTQWSRWLCCYNTSVAAFVLQQTQVCYNLAIYMCFHLFYIDLYSFLMHLYAFPMHLYVFPMNLCVCVVMFTYIYIYIYIYVVMFAFVWWYILYVVRWILYLFHVGSTRTMNSPSVSWRGHLTNSLSVSWTRPPAGPGPGSGLPGPGHGKAMANPRF